MKVFNGNKFRGKTEEDDRTILKYWNYGLGYKLRIDDQNRVYAESEIYIADAIEVKEGNGIYCDK